MDLTGQDLGTIGVLTPGIYRFSSIAQLTGALTLDFAGHPERPFVFQIGTSLTTASASNLTILNGASNSAVYWLIGSSATLGTGTTFAGNILANASITLNTTARILCGRAIALTGAVTMDTNTISNDCSHGGDFGSGRSDFGSRGFSGVDVAGIPEPATWSMLIAGFGIVGAAARLRRQATVSA